MSYARKTIALLAVAVFSMMSVGSAFAAVEDADTSAVNLTVVCPASPYVDLSGDIDFADIDAYGQSTTTLPGVIAVTVEVGCYLGPWQVNASITNFHGSTGSWIHADKFSLVDAETDIYFLEPIDLFGFLEPTANDAVFVGGDSSDAILETAENWFWFFGWHQLPDSPAPFKTTATYTGVLSALGFTLPGEYQATMTVELTFE